MAPRPRVTIASRILATAGKKEFQSSPSSSPVTPAVFSKPFASWFTAPS
jgi:hypothetical protein